MGRLVDVQHRLPVLQGEAGGGLQAVRQGQGRALGGDDAVRLVRDEFFQQSGDVPKVIIKGVPVDAALLDNVLDGDLSEGALLQQAEGGGLYRLSGGKSGHEVLLSSRGNSPAAALSAMRWAAARSSALGRAMSFSNHSAKRPMKPQARKFKR